MNSIFNTHSILTHSTQASEYLSKNDVLKVNNERSNYDEITFSNNKKTSGEDWPEDKATISTDAKNKLEQENKENVKAAGNAKNKSIMEMAAEIKQKIIDDIKESIEKLTEELHKLKGRGDESSKEQAKLLQKQINDLNGQLLTIMTEEL